MGVNRALTIDLIALITASSAVQTLTFPRSLGRHSGLHKGLPLWEAVVPSSERAVNRRQTP